MKKKREISSDFFSILSQDIQAFQEKHHVSKEELKRYLEDIARTLEEKDSFPLSIISKKLTVLESVVKYLKEEKEYSLHKIAELLGRDEKHLWHSYHSARKKVAARFRVEPSSEQVPLQIFSAPIFSPLEALVVYLKDERRLSFRAIAEILSRDDTTVWTTYKRAQKKYGTKK